MGCSSIPRQIRPPARDGWPEVGAPPMLAAIGHAIDFWPWRSLTESQGLDDEKAALLMTEMVQGLAR